ncbi:MAG: hypothetical protein AMXMBFR33_31730 [Candidatus Xenobia bacterium]
MVIQTDAGNKNPRYPNTIVITVSTAGRPVPTHVELFPNRRNGLRSTSYVKAEQVMTVSKDRLESRLGRLDSEELSRVERAVLMSLGFGA